MELLIVIALIAILSVAVLATINPIEQTNKARDAKFKNDAAEVLSAYERYYASQNAYPWNIGAGVTVSFGTDISVGDTDPLFGVLGAGGTGDGVLITTSELKSSFRGKDPFSSPDNIDKMYVYHDGVDSNYVCFVPKANANRTGAVASTLKCMVVDPTGSSSSLTDLGGSCVAMTSTNWTTTADLLPAATRANLLCVPEGNVD